MIATAAEKGVGMIRRLLAAFVLSVLFARSAPAAQCGGDFSAFIAAMSREAAAAGISRWLLRYAEISDCGSAKARFGASKIRTAVTPTAAFILSPRSQPN